MSLLTKHFCFFSFPNLDIYEALVLAERWRGECRPGWWVVLMWQLPRYLYIHCVQKGWTLAFRDPPASPSNLRLRFYGHLLVSRTDRMGSFPIVGRHIWPVLSRSWPSPHFLTCSHSDSRVEFIWYPPLVLLQSAKFREADHLALILQFLFWPCSVLAKPGSIWTGLPWPPFPPPREGIPNFPCRESLLSLFTFPLLKCTGSYLNLELWGKLQRIHCEYVLF